jgi:hypothetical protein
LGFEFVGTTGVSLFDGNLSFGGDVDDAVRAIVVGMDAPEADGRMIGIT